MGLSGLGGEKFMLGSRDGQALSFKPLKFKEGLGADIPASIIRARKATLGRSDPNRSQTGLSMS
jgi:hypothetical protein